MYGGAFNDHFPRYPQPIELEQVLAKVRDSSTSGRVLYYLASLVCFLIRNLLETAVIIIWKNR